MRRIRGQARSLDELSNRGRVVPEFEDPPVRELLVGNYRLLYEVHEKTVAVLGLIHGARDLGALWEREDRSEPDRPA